jgi:hypothetical protein
MRHDPRVWSHPEVSAGTVTKVRVVDHVAVRVPRGRAIPEHISPYILPGKVVADERGRVGVAPNTASGKIECNDVLFNGRRARLVNCNATTLNDSSMGPITVVPDDRVMVDPCLGSHEIDPASGAGKVRAMGKVAAPARLLANRLFVIVLPWIRGNQVVLALALHADTAAPNFLDDVANHRRPGIEDGDTPRAMGNGESFQLGGPILPLINGHDRRGEPGSIEDGRCGSRITSKNDVFGSEVDGF